MIAGQAGVTVPPEPAPADTLPPVEPRAHDWDDDPRTCARYDDRYWDAMYDRDED